MPATEVLRPKGSYEFDNFRLDVAEKILLRDGEPVPLTPKCLATLQILVENAGHLLEKDQLIHAVWPDQFVEEGNVAYTIKLLRKALGDDADAPKYIQTIPRRGYRFIGKLLDSAKTELVITPAVPDTKNESSLVGRVQEISEITDLLLKDGGRLITLTGTGGNYGMH